LFWLGCHHNICLATKILPWTLEKSIITFKNRTQSYQLQTKHGCLHGGVSSSSQF
jgi:hypothetical protein